MYRNKPNWLGAIFIFILAIPASGNEACVSGPIEGQRPGPYSALVAVGSQRGQQHCFICESEDKPMVIIFARSLSEPLGKLAQRLDRAVVADSSAELRAWMTLLTEDQPKLDPQAVRWAKDWSLRELAVGIFEDTVGPPAYLLAKDAEITVLLAVRKRVVANFAFRAGELTPEATETILQAMPRISPSKKK